MHEHMKTAKHTIALELSHGVLYCHACKDHVYHPEIQTMAENHLRREARYGFY